MFAALDESVESFHRVPPDDNSLMKLFATYCDDASPSLHLSVSLCSNIFKHALYDTLHSIINGTGSTIGVDVQFAWRCFTNDSYTTYLFESYKGRRSSK